MKKLIGIIVLIFPVYHLNSENAPQSELIEYTDSEKKAMRNEMIEMDINIRTVASMISLNRIDRLAVLFQRLSEYQMQNSPYHKNGIAGVSRKWKDHSASGFMDEIHEEAGGMAKYFERIKENENPNPDWEIIYKANRKILENCQGCHKRLGVNAP